MKRRKRHRGPQGSTACSHMISMITMGWTKSWQINHCKYLYQVREAAKKSYFLSGQATKAFKPGPATRKDIFLGFPNIKSSVWSW